MREDVRQDLYPRVLTSVRNLWMAALPFGKSAIRIPLELRFWLLWTTVKVGPPRFFLVERVKAVSCSDTRSNGDPVRDRESFNLRDVFSDAPPDPPEPSLDVSDNAL